MTDTDSLFTAYVSLTLALVAAPGATTAVVVRNTLAGGWRAGLWAAAGAAVGNSTHATLAGLGATMMLARTPLTLGILQLAGGAYLLRLALGSLRRVWAGTALPVTTTLLAASDSRPHRAWREGVSVNLLNPAIITFYLTVVPAFVPPGAPRGHYPLLAGLHVAMAFAMHTLWAISLDRLRHWMARPAARTGLELLTAAALLLLGGRVLAAALGTLR